MRQCSDCGIVRTKPPKLGTCPCCFSEMKRFNTGYRITYTCQNNKCKRVVLGSHLSGFWAGWQEKELHVIDEIMKVKIPQIADANHSPSWWLTFFGQVIMKEFSQILINLLESIKTKE